MKMDNIEVNRIFLKSCIIGDYQAVEKICNNDYETSEFSEEDYPFVSSHNLLIKKTFMKKQYDLMQQFFDESKVTPKFDKDEMLLMGLNIAIDKNHVEIKELISKFITTT
jgi:hypothetical protein